MSNLSTVENVYTHLADGDFAPIFEALAPGFEWIEAENIPYSPGHAIATPNEIKTVVFDELAKDFAEIHMPVKRIVDGGSTILVEGRYVGTTNTGKDLDAIYAHVWTFDDDGKLVHFQQYSDTWQWRRVLGADA
jgi:ketosteroid isomerase-like protein